MEKVKATQFMTAKAYTGIPIGPSFFAWLKTNGIDQEEKTIEEWESVYDQFLDEAPVIL